jgi:DNA repair protein RecN (Recombination protein N)
MLKSLYIRNYAIIEEIKLDFDARFNVITGETGAGKSILLGALGLILGKRADTKVLYDQDDKCIVQAEFSLSDQVMGLIPDSDSYDLEHTTTLRREINSKGKSRAFINDTPVLLTELKTVAQVLVDIHNQFDTLSITDLDYQRSVVDIYAKTDKELKAYNAVYKEFTSLKSEIAQLKARQKKGRVDQDYLLFQLTELEKIPLDGLNKTSIEEEHNTLSSSEDIKLTLSEINSALVIGDMSLESRLIDLNRSLSSISDVNSDLKKLHEKMEQLIEDLQDLDRASMSLAESIEHNPERTNELKETLDHIYQLEKKHNMIGIEDLVRLRDQITEQTSSNQDLESLIEQKEQSLAKIKKSLWQCAETLTKKRESCGPQLKKNIESTLKNLAINNANIQLVITELPDFEEHGIDKVDIRFSSNKGIDPQSIEGTASGGELSRLALSVKSLLAGHTAKPTMIFDEIDTGISGAVALQLSHILTNMSDEHQIICITHSPQVASAEGRHFNIYKTDTSKRTITHVRTLSADDRVTELAKMLSTDPPSTAAIANAKELLKVV